MNRLPTLETERLILRQFERSDQGAVQRILSDPRVSATLLDIPEPFLLSDAELWIRGGHAGIVDNELLPFAIVRWEDDQVMGCIDLEINAEHRRADMAYWIGSGYWGHGYTSEAARRIVCYGFQTLKLNRIYAQCLAHNVASARVMQKAGLKYEATLRQSTLKNDRLVDMVVYGLLRSDYPAVENKDRSCQP
jgi:ribosomal-protein-alanine N-acetyltransferase